MEIQKSNALKNALSPRICPSYRDDTFGYALSLPSQFIAMLARGECTIENVCGLLISNSCKNVLSLRIRPWYSDDTLAMHCPYQRTPFVQLRYFGYTLSLPKDSVVAKSIVNVRRADPEDETLYNWIFGCQGSTCCVMLINAFLQGI